MPIVAPSTKDWDAGEPISTHGGGGRVSILKTDINTEREREKREGGREGGRKWWWGNNRERKRESKREREASCLALPCPFHVLRLVYV
jgi:hypothetical protein